MLSLATPVPGMFLAVRKSTYDMLKVNFEEFKMSAAYDSLGKICRWAKISYDRRSGRGSSGSILYHEVRALSDDRIYLAAKAAAKAVGDDRKYSSRKERGVEIVTCSGGSFGWR